MVTNKLLGPSGKPMHKVEAKEDPSAEMTPQLALHLWLNQLENMRPGASRATLALVLQDAMQWQALNKAVDDVIEGAISYDLICKVRGDGWAKEVILCESERPEVQAKS